MSAFVIHPTITQERVIDACERRSTTLDSPGFCTACGEDADECEPDACKYKCQSCGEMAVYGAEEVLLMMPF